MLCSSGFRSYLKAVFLGVSLAVLGVYVITQCMELRYVIERDIERHKRPLSARLAVSANPLLSVQSPVSQLLQLEQQQGLLSVENYQLAKRVQAHAENTLADQFQQQTIDSYAQAVAFLTAMGRYLDRHYTYQSKLPLGQGLVLGALDCDMRSFLYLSVAMSLGFEDFYFVLAPGHALIGWQGAGDEILLWETTSRLGNVADLSNSNLYLPATSKRYGDYQLASYRSALLQSQVTASAAWALSRGSKADSLVRALDLFDRSLEQFPSANHAAAKILLGSDNLLVDMPASPAYAEYAAVYPYSVGAQLYRLSVFLDALPATHTADYVEHADALLKQGVVSPVVDEVLLRYGSVWQRLDALYLQRAAKTLARVLYPSEPFLTSRDAVAEGRAIIYISIYASVVGAFIAGLLVFFQRRKACSIQR